MRILVAGDTHGNQNYSRYLVDTAVANNCDSVFVVGDWGYWEHQPDGVRFCNKLNEYCVEKNIPTYFLDGNHDKTSLLLDKYSECRDEEGFILVRSHLRYAGRGHRWTWDGIRFISLGGAYSVDKDLRLQLEANEMVYRHAVSSWPLSEGESVQSGWGLKYRPEDLWFPEEEMSDVDMAQILENQDHVDVILAHDKPRGSNPKWNREDRDLCVPNQDRLQLAVRTLQPRWFLHGHLHYAYTDFVQYSTLDGEARVVEVRGLDCDPESAGYSGYKLVNSWHILDTDDLFIAMLD